MNTNQKRRMSALKTSFLAATALSLSTFAASLAVAAGPSLILGQPNYGGTGCPAGSAATVLNSSSDQLSVLFDQYVAEAGGTSGKRIDRKACNLVVPVQIPQGYSIALVQADYRGFVAVPSGGRAILNSETFFAGSQGMVQKRSFAGPVVQDYIVSQSQTVKNIVWSKCGASENLRVSTGLFVQTNSANQQVLGTVDSTDVTSGIVYHVKWRQCP